MSEEKTIPGELDAINKRLDDGAGKFDDAFKRIDRIEGKQTFILNQIREIRASQKQQAVELKKNTEVTTEVRDFMRAGRAGATFLKWASVVVTAVVTLAGAAWTAWHNFGARS